ncbi:MAG: cadherin repeat domain-containing protein, partial [Sphingomonas sp.]
MARFADDGFVTLWVTLDATQDGSGNAIKGQRFDANGSKVGSEFLVNTQGAGSQFNPSVAVLSNGNFIATWISNDTTQDGSGSAVKGQIFSASGVTIGGEFLVNSSVAGSQFTSTVVALTNGGFVVSWDDWNSFDTRARIFGANGVAIGADFILNNNVNGTQDGSDLVALASGGFVATWRTTDTTADGIGDAVKARIFDAAGNAVGSEFRVNTQTTGSQNSPSISQLVNGNLIVTWYSSDTLQDGSNGAVKAQIFSPTGVKIGAEFLVNLQTVNTQNDPVVTSLPDGFMVAWVSSDPLQDGSGMAIKARVFNAAGVPVGSEFLVDTLKTGDQFLPELVTLSDGRVVAAWTSDNGDGSGYAVRSQILAPSSTPESVVSYYRAGTEFAVNTSVTDNQTAPAMARFADGGFVTLWGTSNTTQDGSDSAIKGQRFDANGNKVGSEFLVNSQGTGSQFTPSVAVLNNGSFIATWISTDTTQDGSGNAVKGQIFSASGAPVGGEFLVNSSVAGTQFTSTVVALANGGFVVSWDDWNSFDTRARIFGANGVAIGADFILNNKTDYAQEYGDLVALASGGFVATWRTTDTTADGDGQALKARIFDAAGNPVGNEFLVDTQATGFQYSPSISQLANGNLIITWYTTDPLQDGSDGAVKAQIFSPTGAKIGAEFLVNAQTVNLQNDPVVTSLPNGGFMVAWESFDPLQDGSGMAIKARVFNADGVPVGSEFLVNTLGTGDQFLPELVTLADGRVVAAWASTTGDGSGYAVRAQILAPNSAPVITSNGAGATAGLVAAENQSAVTQVVATDLGGGGPVTYSISGGADAARFTINTTTGVLSFVTAPNFEVRTDANSDGIYDVVVRASDGELSDT